MNFTNPISHTDDPGTSAEAAAIITANGMRARHAERILVMIRAHPESTAIELASHQTGEERLNEYQIRRRLVDLEDAGKVQKGPARACRIRGTKMVTWKAV